ncbi:winged helix-turn-helix transcriptional regulator [Chryseomicrobium excrementi]|uniref:winged helix-turn-helix transcriptional regulator n=1 Tax=Chryseomicrobium excrementi TaxID=2041346 RepID=UPI003CCB9DFC
MLDDFLDHAFNIWILDTENEVPPRVEYSITDKGLTLRPLLEAMHSWGSLMMD